MSDAHVAAYISDHLDELKTMREMLDYLGQKENKIEHHRFFVRVQLEMAEDEKILKKLLTELEESEDDIFQVRGISPGNARRLVFTKGDMDPGTLGFFEALEMLVLGSQGTSLLWRVLASVASRIPALRGVDFKSLEKRAKNQRDRVESVRLDVASQVLLGN